MGGCKSTNNANKFKALGAIQRDSKSGNPQESSLGQLDSTERVDSFGETRTVTLGGLKLRYASISIRGHYPDSM